MTEVMPEYTADVLVSKSEFKDLTYKEAKELVLKDNMIKEGESSTVIISTLGEKYFRKLVISYFAINILNDLNVKLCDEDVLLTKVLGHVDFTGFISNATTIQSLLKDWVAHTIVTSDYSTLSFDSVINLMKIRQTIIVMADYLPPSIIGSKEVGKSIVKNAYNKLSTIQKLD